MQREDTLPDCFIRLRKLQCCTFDGTNHGPISSPFLSISKVGLGIQVRGDKQTPRIFVYAKLGELYLVVVDVPIEANHNCSYLRDNYVENTLSRALGCLKSAAGPNWLSPVQPAGRTDPTVQWREPCFPKWSQISVPRSWMTFRQSSSWFKELHRALCWKNWKADAWVYDRLPFHILLLATRSQRGGAACP